MNRTTCIHHAKRLALGLAALALAAAPSFAQTTVDLCATTGTATVTTGVSVPIWGFVLGSTCAPGDATLPNPVIRAIAGETLTVNLTNNLSEAVSFFVPGVRGPAPVLPEHFTTEAAASGGSASYTFTPDAGTYLYQSATARIRTHVPMGLYGALVVDVAPGEAYPGVTYSQDEVLVYSAIDPAINSNPASYGGARVSKNELSIADEGPVYGWLPQYFLINGKAFPSTDDVAINTGSDVLLRFVNAGLETVVPTLDGGLYMDLIAEDGNLQPVAFSQYGLELQPGKTFDALINVANDGSYPLYDRALNLTNGMAGGGGMLVYLDAAPVPTAVDDAYPATEDALLQVPARGVLTNDLAADGASSIPVTYNASLVSDVANGTLVLATDGSFDYTPDPNFTGIDGFTYRAVDTAAGPDSNVATVTITVANVDNDPPVADPQSVVTPIYTPVAITLTGSDPEGDALSFAISVPPANGSVDGLGAAVSYTPNSGFYGVDSFTFNVSDGVNTSTDATVTITVVPTFYFSTAGQGAQAVVPGVAAAAPPAGGYDNADIYYYDGTTGDGSIPGTYAPAFSRVFDATVGGGLPLPTGANIDGLIVEDATHFYVSFLNDTTIQGFGAVQNEDIVYYDNGTWSVYFDGTAAGLTLAGHNLTAFDIVGGILYFSAGAALPPGVLAAAPPAAGDNADIYSWDGTAFSRVFDANTGGGLPLPGNASVDGLSWIDATHFYMSFAADSTVVPGLGAVQDEDIVEYNSGTWSVYFDGTAAGLGTYAAQDIAAMSIP